jgi:hypothetical protein
MIPPRSLAKLLVPRTHALLLFACALAAALLPALATAQPDPLALVRRAVNLHAANAERSLSMAFREHVHIRDLHANGTTRNEKTKVHDVFLVEGSPQRVLLSEDGTAQDAAAIRSSQDFLRTVEEVRRAENSDERAKRIQAYQRRPREFGEAVAEIPDAFRFRLTGEETIGQHTCYRLHATPREGYRPRTRFGRIFTRTDATIWIDKTSGEWRRVDAELVETVNLGWIFVQIRQGSRARVEQLPFPGAGWQMSNLSYFTVARVGLFLNYRRESNMDYWNYAPMSQDLWASAFRNSYPSGSLAPPAR